ncbi:MAG: cell wall hydrolase [Syntrophales bacterium]|nr:cell wall hydrolase [Syntrophales bacterium]
MRFIDKPIFLALPIPKLMGLCIEREAGGESREGRIGIGTIILERVDHRDWDGKTIQEVILWPWQFTWTMPEEGLAYYEEALHIAMNWDDAVAHDKALQECFEIAQGMRDGTIPRDPDLAAVNCCQYVAARYRKFMDAHPEKKCTRWWQKMKLIKTIPGPTGGHEFYV